MLELASFRKAISSLSESLDWYRDKSTVAPSEILRDSAIHRFKYTYELAWKMMKRWLEVNIGASYVDGISRRELFRMAAEQEDIIRQILDEFIPDRKVMVFGSRISSTAKPYSDLDLVIMGDEPVELSTLALLKNAFAESDLPFRADVLQWCRTSPEFREVVESQLQPIGRSDHPPLSGNDGL